MCLTSLVIARNCYLKETQMFLGVQTIVEPNLDRIAVRISGAALGNVNASIATSQSDAAAGVGLIAYRSISSASSDVIGALDVSLNLAVDGPVVQGRLFILVNGQNCKLYETIMNPDLARAVREHEAKLLYGGRHAI